MNRAVTAAKRNWRLETGANLGLRHDVSLWYRFAVTSVGPVHLGVAEVYAAKCTASFQSSTLVQG